MNKLPFLLLALAASATAMTDTPLQRCRALTDDRARLACYDALPIGTASPPATTAAKPADAASFGLPAPAAPAEEMRSRIAGRFDGWEAKTVLRLENGQHWQITDGSRTAYSLESPHVRITPSAFGGFVMDIEGVSQRARVRRVK
jgi:hypothetical protein